MNAVKSQIHYRNFHPVNLKCKIIHSQTTEFHCINSFLHHFAGCLNLHGNLLHWELLEQTKTERKLCIYALFSSSIRHFEHANILSLKLADPWNFGVFISVFQFIQFLQSILSFESTVTWKNVRNPRKINVEHVSTNKMHDFPQLHEISREPNRIYSKNSTNPEFASNLFKCYFQFLIFSLVHHFFGYFIFIRVIQFCSFLW